MLMEGARHKASYWQHMHGTLSSKSCHVQEQAGTQQGGNTTSNHVQLLLFAASPPSSGRLR